MDMHDAPGDLTRLLRAREKRSLIWLCLLALFLLLFPAFIGNEFFIDIMVLTFIFAVASQAWNILSGFGGQFSLGHTVFFGFGAYTSTLLYIYYGLTPWIGMILGGVVAALIGEVFLYPSFRLRGTYFTLTTMAFGQIAWLIALYWRELTFGGTGAIIENHPGLYNCIFRSKVTYYYLSLALLLVVTVLCCLIRGGKLGYQLIALREEEDAAESLGIDTTACKTRALIVSAFFTALAGTLYAQYQLYIHPDTVFSLAMSTQFALTTVIGGIGTVLGPIVGSLLVVPSDSLLRAWLGSRWAGAGFIIYGTLVIFVVRYFPQGMIGRFEERTARNVKLLLDAVIGRKTAAEWPAPHTSSIFSRDAVGMSETCGGSDVILKVDHLTKHFAGVVAVSNVSFQVRRGERLGIIGPNGAGKTTLFNLITGFTRPDSGVIVLDGVELPRNRKPHLTARRGIARTFQIVRPFAELTVLENLIATAGRYCASMAEAREKSLDMLEFVKLEPFRNHRGKDVPIGVLKRLELGRALLTQPKLLMLDEVMGGLNPAEREDILSLVVQVNQAGVTIMLIEHIMRVIMNFSERIIVVDHGVFLAEGNPSEISQDTRVVEAYLGKEYINVGMSKS
jgi:branched-chain amino acid transport system permease protein